MNRVQLVVAYVRVSTPEQEKHGYGIKVQRRDVRAFAQWNKLVLDRVYAEKGESGALEDRTQLERLMHDCERGLIRTLIIPSIDRLSRDVRIAENLFWRFDKLGVEVLIVDMPTYDVKDRKAVLLRQIREAFAEENRKDTIEKLWKGRQERARSGKPAGGMVPYGFRRRRKRFHKHPVESVIVKRIFEMTGAGASGTEIAAALNRSGYRRRNGKPWTRRQVLSIARRPDLYQEGKLRYGAITAFNETLILIEARGVK